MCIRLLKTLKFLALIALPFASYGVDGCTFVMRPFFFMKGNLCIVCGVVEQPERARLCRSCTNDRERQKSILLRKPAIPAALEGEVWVGVPGYEGLYEASSLGRIKVLDRVTESVRNNTVFKVVKYQKVLSPDTDRDGYFQVTLSQNRKIKNFKVHRLVCLSFHPNPENKPTVNHKNGIKTDNRPENLEWATMLENRREAIRLGLWDKKGEKHPLAKLTDTQVLEIREKMKTQSQTAVALEYGVSQVLIGRIHHRKIWTHI